MARPQLHEKTAPTAPHVTTQTLFVAGLGLPFLRLVAAMNHTLSALDIA